MKNMRNWRRFAVGLLLSGLGMQGAVAMTDSVPTKTVCAGRFAVAIPSGATVRMDASYHGIRVNDKRHVADFAEISNGISAQAKKYQAAKSEMDPRVAQMLHAGGADPSKMLSPTQLVGTHADPARQQAVIAYHTQPDSLDVTVELHALIDTHEWVFTLTQTSAGDFARDSATLAEAANRFKPIQQQMTTMPGFCVLGGVFTDASKPEVGESMTLAINDPAHKDMDLTFESRDFSRPMSELPREDMDRDLATLKQHIPDLKVLTRGARTAGGQDGYLIAVTGTDPDLGGARFYKYYWTTAGKSNDAMKPALSVELLTHANSVSEETFKDADEVTHYFERILQGIRERTSAR